MGDPSSQNGTSNGESHSASSSSVTDHLSQALRDLARGETAAAALEANLANLEDKLDDILASFGVTADGPNDEASAPASGTSGNDQDKGAGSAETTASKASDGEDKGKKMGN